MGRESADKIVLVRFGPGGARIESEARIGLMPTDINGPHGVAVSPDKQFVYVAQGDCLSRRLAVEISRWQQYGHQVHEPGHVSGDHGHFR